AVRVQDREHAERAELGDEAGVDVRGDPGRDAAREHAGLGALRQIEQLLDEAVDLGLGYLRAALVDLGLLARRGVDDREVRARLAGNPRERVQDRLLGQQLED